MPTIPTLLHGLTPAVRERLVASLPAHQLRALARAFPEWAHSGQLAPAGDWRTWVIMAGRGFGKTRAGAEWVLDMVRGSSPWERGTSEDGGGARAQKRNLANSGTCPSTTFGGPPPRSGEDLRIALIAATIDEARAVLVEGPSGILACARPVRSPTGCLRCTCCALPMGPKRGSIRGHRPGPCAGRSIILPGATSWPSGAIRRRAGTCSSSACVAAMRRVRW